LRFHGAQVGVLDLLRTPWEHRPGVTATLYLETNKGTQKYSDYSIH